MGGGGGEELGDVTIKQFLVICVVFVIFIIYLFEEPYVGLFNIQKLTRSVYSFLTSSTHPHLLAIFPSKAGPSHLSGWWVRWVRWTGIRNLENQHGVPVMFLFFSFLGPSFSNYISCHNKFFIFSYCHRELKNKPIVHVNFTHCEIYSI